MRMPILMLPPRGSHVTWDERVSNLSFAEMRMKKTGVVVTEPWQDALGHWVIEVQEDGGKVHVVPPGRIVSWETYGGPPTGLLAAQNGAAKASQDPKGGPTVRPSFVVNPSSIAHGTEIVWSTLESGGPSDTSGPEVRRARHGVAIGAPYRSGRGWVVEAREMPEDVLHVVPLSEITRWMNLNVPLLFSQNPTPSLAPGSPPLLVESVPLPADPCDGLVFLAKIPPRPEAPRPDESVARQEIERRLVASLGGSGRSYPVEVYELARHAAQAIWLRDERIAMLDRWLLEHNLALREEDRLAGRTPSREP